MTENQINTSREFEQFYFDLPENVRQSIEEKFWNLVNINGSHCWIWTGKSRANGGYGRFCAYKKITIRAHRFSYLIYRGSIPDLHICHSCDTPSCVNPAHLWPGTDFDNLTDMRNKGRHTYVPIGELNPNTPFVEGDIHIIRWIYDTFQISSRKLSILFKCSDRAMLSIVKRESWKHLP